jgi:hypothetical protein
MLTLAGRLQRHSVRYSARQDSPAALSVAKIALEDGSRIVSDAPADEEEITGDAAAVENVRLSVIQDQDRLDGIHTAQMSTPLALVAHLIGRSGRNRLATLLTTGVLLNVAGRIDESGKGEATVFLSACDSDNLSRVQKLIKDLTLSMETQHRAIEADERQIDWLLTQRRSQLERILHTQGTSLSVKNDNLVIYGTELIALKESINAITELFYELHMVTLWTMRPIPALTLSRAVQASGAEASTHVDTPTFTLYGTQGQLQAAISNLAASSDVSINQIKYRLTQSEEIREFISGKKDGKLIKIMKESGSVLSLHTLSEDQIALELVGSTWEDVSLALELLLGEFPAELAFYLSDAHHKRLIGHGGKTIQRVMKKHAVYIKFLAPTEASERCADTLPRSLAVRLDNVIVRTPAKNVEALRRARTEIYEMAGEEPGHPVNRLWKLDRCSLLRLDEGELKQLADFMRGYAETLDCTTISSEEEQCFCIRVAGYPTAHSRFFDSITIFQHLQYHQEESNLMKPVSPQLDKDSPPMSPTWTTNSSIFSNGSGTSWTSQSPELFRHFPMSILQPPSSPKAPLSPALSEDFDNLTLPSPTDIPVREFDPAIGAQRKCLWQTDFPKLSFLTMEALDGQDDSWITGGSRAIQYRRRALSIFRA